MASTPRSPKKAGGIRHIPPEELGLWNQGRQWLDKQRRKKERGTRINFLGHDVVTQEKRAAAAKHTERTETKPRPREIPEEWLGDLEDLLTIEGTTHHAPETIPVADTPDIKRYDLDKGTPLSGYAARKKAGLDPESATPPQSPDRTRSNPDSATQIPDTGRTKNKPDTALNNPDDRSSRTLEEAIARLEQVTEKQLEKHGKKHMADLIDHAERHIEAQTHIDPAERARLKRKVGVFRDHVGTNAKFINAFARQVRENMALITNPENQQTMDDLATANPEDLKKAGYVVNTRYKEKPKKSDSDEEIDPHKQAQIAAELEQDRVFQATLQQSRGAHVIILSDGSVAYKLPGKSQTQREAAGYKTIPCNEEAALNELVYELLTEDTPFEFYRDDTTGKVTGVAVPLKPGEKREEPTQSTEEQQPTQEAADPQDTAPTPEEATQPENAAEQKERTPLEAFREATKRIEEEAEIRIMGCLDPEVEERLLLGEKTKKTPYTSLSYHVIRRGQLTGETTPTKHRMNFTRELNGTADDFFIELAREENGDVLLNLRNPSIAADGRGFSVDMSVIVPREIGERFAALQRFDKTAGAVLLTQLGDLVDELIYGKRPAPDQPIQSLDLREYANIIVEDSLGELPEWAANWNQPIPQTTPEPVEAAAQPAERQAEPMQEKEPAKTPEEFNTLVDKGLEIILKEGRVSGSLLERTIGVNYTDAWAIINRLEAVGIVSGERADGARPREILISDADAARALLPEIKRNQKTEEAPQPADETQENAPAAETESTHVTVDGIRFQIGRTYRTEVSPNPTLRVIAYYPGLDELHVKNTGNRTIRLRKGDAIRNSLVEQEKREPTSDIDLNAATEKSPSLERQPNPRTEILKQEIKEAEAALKKLADEIIANLEAATTRDARKKAIGGVRRVFAAKRKTLEDDLIKRKRELIKETEGQNAAITKKTERISISELKEVRINTPDERPLLEEQQRQVARILDIHATLPPLPKQAKAKTPEKKNKRAKREKGKKQPTTAEIDRALEQILDAGKATKKLLTTGKGKMGAGKVDAILARFEEAGIVGPTGPGGRDLLINDKEQARAALEAPNKQETAPPEPKAEAPQPPKEKIKISETEEIELMLAIEKIYMEGEASIAVLRSQLKWKEPRARRVIQLLEEAGIVSALEGGEREVLIPKMANAKNRFERE